MLSVWMDRLAFIFLCLLVAVLPVSKAGIEICAAAAILFFLGKKAFLFFRGKGPWGQRVNLPGPVPALLYSLLIFFLATLLSVVMSHFPDLSWRAFLGKTLQAVLLFLVVQEVVISREHVRRIALVFLITAAVVAVDAAWQMVFGQDFFRGLVSEYGRLTASFKHPNSLGAYCMAVLPVAFVWLRRIWAQKKYCRISVLSGILFIVLLAVLLMTYSRSAWTGAVVAFAVLAWLDRSLRKFLMFGIVLLMIVSPFVFMQGRNFASGTGSFMSARDLSRIDGGMWQTLMRDNSRFIYWSDALSILRDNPLWGAGLNTYARVIRQYSEVDQAYPHNCYLQMAAELGVIGVLAFFYFLLQIFRAARLRLANKTSFDPELTHAFLAAFAGLCVQSFFDTTLYSSQLAPLFWLLAGLAVVGAGTALSPGQSNSVPEGSA